MHVPEALPNRLDPGFAITFPCQESSDLRDDAQYIVDTRFGRRISNVSLLWTATALSKFSPGSMSNFTDFEFRRRRGLSYLGIQ